MADTLPMLCLAIGNQWIYWLFGNDYEVAMKDTREDIMCSIIEQKIVIGDDTQKKRF
jgi:hypothetical protein